MTPAAPKFSHDARASSRLMKAPYPVRLKDSGFLDYAVAYLQRECARFGLDFIKNAKAPLSAHVIERWLMDCAPGVLDAFGDYGSPRVAMLTAILGHVGGGIPIFEATTALLEMLDHTDLSDEITADQLRLPFTPTIYLRLPTSDTKFQQSDGSQRYPLDGVLIRETRIQTASASNRVWDVAVASALVPTSTDIFDDAVFVRPFELPDDDGAKPVLEVLKDYDITRQAFGLDRAPPPGSALEEAREKFRDILALVAKVLLYINLPGARKVERKELTSMRGTKAPTSPAKQAKLMRRLAGHYDCIEIGPTWEDSGLGGGAGAGDQAARRAHLRRGHFRNQRVGQGRSERRLTWVRPTIVGQHEGQNPSVKDYRITN